MKLRAALASLSLCAAACGGALDDTPLDEAEVAPDPLDSEADAKSDRASTDGVELKIVVRDDQRARAERLLRLTAARGSARDVYFYDTPELALFEGGVILRGRDASGSSDDTTVKVRPLAAADAPAELLRLGTFKCEEDRDGSRRVPSCSLTAKESGDELQAAADGEREVKKLFSASQEGFAEAFAPGEEVAWDALAVLGPTPTRLWKLSPRDLDAQVTAERWELPDGTVILELSTKTTKSEADALWGDFSRWVRGKGLSVAATSETKTRTTLEYWASHE